MFAHDPRVPRILNDIVIGTDENKEFYGCEKAERCCNFECEYCKTNKREYLQFTGKKPSNKNIKDLKVELEPINAEIEYLKLIPFDKHEVVEY